MSNSKRMSLNEQLGTLGENGWIRDKKLKYDKWPYEFEIKLGSDELIHINECYLNKLKKPDPKAAINALVHLVLNTKFDHTSLFATKDRYSFKLFNERDVKYNYLYDNVRTYNPSLGVKLAEYLLKQLKESLSDINRNYSWLPYLQYIVLNNEKEPLTKKRNPNKYDDDLVGTIRLSDTGKPIVETTVDELRKQIHYFSTAEIDITNNDYPGS